MTVRVYRWDDNSAPVLNGVAGALITVLDACLVNGYGSKIAAGWTKPHSGTNTGAYQQGATSNGFYLRVSDTGSTDARVVGYETMSNVDTGTGPFPTTVQQSGGLFMRKSSSANSTARPWLIAADAKRFHLWVGHDVTTSTGLSTTTYQMLYFFGDTITPDAGDIYSTVIGADVSAAQNYGGALSGSASGILGGHFIARRHDGTGGSGTLVRNAQSIQTSGYPTIGTCIYAPAYPDPVTNGMILSEVHCFDASPFRWRGSVPGLWAPIHSALPGSPGDTFSGTGELAGKSFLLLDAANYTSRARPALEISDTWE